jgi:hypothetical protein
MSAKKEPTNRTCVKTRKPERDLLPEIHRLARDLLHIHTTEEIGEDNAHLVPSEVDADAGVFAGGEGVVGVGAEGGFVSMSATDSGGVPRGRT